jgi:hypothetical protein
MHSSIRNGTLAALLGAALLGLTGCGGAPPAPPKLVADAPPGPGAGTTFELPSGQPDVPALQVTVVQAGNRGKPIGGMYVVYHMIAAAQGKAPYIDSRAGGKPREKIASVPEMQPGIELMFDHMQVGDRWKAVVPPQMGFGPNSGAKVPANATLEIDIEILDVKK